MHFQIRGIVHGKSIELERETGLPDGSSVSVQIDAGELPVDEKRRRIKALCGSWTDQSLDGIFAEVGQRRESSALREPELDRPS